MLDKFDGIRENLTTLRVEIGKLQTLADVAFWFCLIGAVTSAFFLGNALGF